MNYSELLQLAKGWGNSVYDRFNIWRLLFTKESLGVLKLEIMAQMLEKKKNLQSKRVRDGLRRKKEKDAKLVYTK